MTNAPPCTYTSTGAPDRRRRRDRYTSSRFPRRAGQLIAAFEHVVTRAVDIRARMALTIECRGDPELHALLTTRSPVRATVLAQARRLLADLGISDIEQRAVDLIGVMNGLFYDRLFGNGVSGAPVDATAVLKAWLTGVAAASPSQASPR